MGLIFSGFSTSLDGFIANSHDQVGHLCDWYDNGDVEVYCGLRVDHSHVPGQRRLLASKRHRGRLPRRTGHLRRRPRLGRPLARQPTIIVTHRLPLPDWPAIPDDTGGKDAGR